MNSYQDYRAVIWSSVNLALLHALWQDTAEDGGIPVQLGYEPDNLVDSQAVMIVLSSYTVQKLLDVEPVTVGDADSIASRVVHWRLGYIRRSDPNRDTLQRGLTERDTPLAASLLVDGHAWRVRVYEESDPDEIPF